MITEKYLKQFDNASIEELKKLVSIEVVNKIINFNKSIEILVNKNIIDKNIFNNSEKIDIVRLTGNNTHKLYEISYKCNKIKYCNKCNKYFDFLHNEINHFDKEECNIYNVNHKEHKLKYIYQ